MTGALSAESRIQGFGPDTGGCRTLHMKKPEKQMGLGQDMVTGRKRNQNMRMLDMHAHLLCLSDGYGEKLTDREMQDIGVQELALRREYGVDTVFSCGTPRELDVMERYLREAGPDEDTGAEKNAQAERKKSIQAETEKNAQTEEKKLSQFEVEKSVQSELQHGAGEIFRSGAEKAARYAGCGRDYLSFGIHPWQSDRWQPQEWRGYFQRVPLIGEIGMDSVWTTVPLQTQRRVFAQQLEIAADLGRPVILHTKGQEAQIAEMIRGFPGHVCVHWYSGDEKSFEEFLEMGSFFTLGPDLSEACGPAADEGLYGRMLREIPAERLFLETDGLSSIAWMRGHGAEDVPFAEIPAVLGRNLNFAAGRKQMAAEAFQALIWSNFREFLD